ncbi:hypothetical protein SAFG77S_00796 [Streptomyces afghaniensis]
MVLSRVRSLTVDWMAEPSPGVTETVPSEDTLVVYGRLSTVMPLTPSTPTTLAVQPLVSKVWEVRNSVAVPERPGCR